MSQVKFYSSKSNAKRAAAKAGVEMATAELLEQDGQFAYVAPQVNAEDTLLVSQCGHSTCPSCEIHLSNGLMDFNSVVGSVGSYAKAYAEQQTEWSCMGCGHGFGAAVAAPTDKPATVATGTGLKIEKAREERNGLKRPSVGGVCRAVWDACDKVNREEDGRVITSKEIQALAVVHGWNANNASIEYYNWRKFMGVRGRQAKV